MNKKEVNREIKRLEDTIDEMITKIEEEQYISLNDLHKLLILIKYMLILLAKIDNMHKK